MTERARYLFTVKEYEGGTPWIMAERRDANISPLNRGFLGFDLVAGTSFEDARKIADYLNKHVEALSYTAI